MSVKLPEITPLFNDIKSLIDSARQRAAVAVNAELIRLYWEIGQLLHSRQQAEGWGGWRDSASGAGYSQRTAGSEGLFGTEYWVYDPFRQRIRDINFATGCCKITGAGLACRYSLGSSLLVD